MDVFFVSLKEEIPNKSVSEILGSLPLKIFSSILRILFRKSIFHMKYLGKEGGNEQLFHCLCHSNKQFREKKCFNAESFGTNLKLQKSKTKMLACLFYIGEYMVKNLTRQ